jgi:hypothetical protein
VSTAYQIASLYDDNLVTYDQSTLGDQVGSPQQPTIYAYLTVYQPGAFDPTSIAHAHPVTIDGHPGLEANDPLYSWAASRTLAWQYRTDAWAVINSSSTNANDPSATDLRQLAAGLRATPPQTARVPFTMGYVPSGYQLDEVGMHAMSGLNGIAAAREGDYAGLLFSKPALRTTGLSAPFGGVEGDDPPGSFYVFVVPAGNSNQHPSPGITCGNGFCNRWADNGTVNLQVASGGRLSNQEMTDVLQSITVGNVHDDSTWVDVTTAVP